MARILIVEDNLANMKLACLLLRNAGHSVLCAADAETGLTLARTERPDLVLMDIQLPGMDGLAATALLKSDPVTAGIPVIALTAMAMKADQEKTRVAGCDAYIAKPLRYQEFYAVIDSLLDATKVPPTGAAGSFHRPAPSFSTSGQHAMAVEPQSRDQARRDGRLILLAEDQAANQRIIVRQLALLGFVTDVTNNGREALERWQAGDYAMLFTDLHMPEMDGFQLCAAIREQEDGMGRVPIVALSASTSKREADRYQTPDMDAFLSKPLQLADLKATLEKWLPRLANNLPLHNEPSPMSAGGHAVDLKVLERLVGDDPEVVREFLDDFRISATRIALELTAACTEHRAVSASEQAHMLMSSARAMGALALGDLCAEMERAGNAGDTGTLTTLLPTFEREFDAVIASLDALQIERAGQRVDG